MQIGLFDFQNKALAELHEKVSEARPRVSVDNPQGISFSAPTGAGKTIIMTAFFEDILGKDKSFNKQVDNVVVWISDMPELNEQTRLKIESKSDLIDPNQLIVIDAEFDAERLEGGHIYFLNTQKLGKDKRLTRKGDNRQFTIWETLTNTAETIPNRFYVVIDEAHRGMRTDKEEKIAQTYLQRFLKGYTDDGLCQMPLVIGITATPARFENLLSGTTRTTYKVIIEAEAVKESGLIKERILIHYPDTPVTAEMTLLSEAANHWQQCKEYWEKYCMTESEKVVRPILVIQVEDGAGKLFTKTNISHCLTSIEKVIGRELNNNEIAHTFNEKREHEAGRYMIRHIDASRIEEEDEISLVFFKMSLSTGWDCPRAEVMMSFRRAQDHTYIAQLMGRMVRTPLARRIEKNVALNEVHLFLPNYDKSTVESVIHDLRNTEDVPPSDIVTGREKVILNRRKDIDKVFEAMTKLPTYRVNAVRKQSSLRRLMGLGRRLTHTKIDKEAQKEVTGRIVDKMTKVIQQMQQTEEFQTRADQITHTNLKTIEIEHADQPRDNQIKVFATDIERLFRQAGRHLGNGLHIKYWKEQSKRSAEEIQVEVIVLAEHLDSMRQLEAYAEAQFNELHEKNIAEIRKLNEKQRKQFVKLLLSANELEHIDWPLGENIDFNRSPDYPEYKKHLFLEVDGKFRADLGTWEDEVIRKELMKSSVIGWLRNMPRKPWALEIPYEYGGETKSMFPDLIVVRKDKGADKYLFDILEPHNPSLNDNVAKAKGLAKFSGKHWMSYDRVQLIRDNGKNQYLRLDVGIEHIRNKVLGAADNHRLDEIFNECATSV